MEGYKWKSNCNSVVVAWNVQSRRPKIWLVGYDLVGLSRIMF